MNRAEAIAVLEGKLDEYRRQTYAELAVRVGEQYHLEVLGPSGVEYQVEIQVLSESPPEEDVLVAGWIDDGGLRAFCPLYRSFRSYRTANRR